MKHAELSEPEGEWANSRYELSDEVEKVITVGTIKAGEEAKVEYDLYISEVSINKYNNGGEFVTPEITGKSSVRVVADELSGEIKSNDYNLKIEQSDVSLFVHRTTPYYISYNNGSTVAYIISINLTDKEKALDGMVVKFKIPDGLSYKDISYNNASEDARDLNVVADHRGQMVEFTIGELRPEDALVLRVYAEVGDVIGDFYPEVVATVNGREHYGNIIKSKAEKSDLSVEQIEPESLYVKEGNEIEFQYRITNNAKVSSRYDMTNIIPDGLEMVSIERIFDDYPFEMPDNSQDKLEISEGIAINQVQIYKIKMKAKLLPEGVREKQATNYAVITPEGGEPIQTNKVTITIEYNDILHREDNSPFNPITEEELNSNDSDNPEDPNNPNNPVTKKIISGIAWMDKNNNGAREDEEERLTDIEVRLFDKNTNSQIATATTSSTGEYAFTDLDEGEYFVVFLYDSDKYVLTQYNAKEVSESTNSDFLGVDMEIDGETRKVAISDIIRISSSNVRNIDIGLTTNRKSIMKLDKYISNITATYGNTVKKYDYNNDKLVKVEIPRNDMSKASVIVEYKIMVTNEGDVANYVRKIVDYVPAGMRFNSELNRDWYQSSNGDIYNSSLSNTKIEPGETKEVTLTLTKQMTDTNTGIVNNTAEIYELYNEEGIVTTSIPGNKAAGEMDMSSADVVIGVKTGSTTLNILIIVFLVLALIGTGGFTIHKTILKKDEIEDIKEVY